MEGCAHSARSFLLLTSALHARDFSRAVSDVWQINAGIMKSAGLLQRDLLSHAFSEAVV